MKNIKFIIFGMIILFVAALLFTRLTLVDIAPYLGYNQYKDLVEVASPDGRYIAAGCHIIGGATTSDSTFVVIRLKGEALNYKKNDLLFMVDNLDSFDVLWTTNDELVVKYTTGPIYTQKSNWKDIAIRYIQK